MSHRRAFPRWVTLPGSFAAGACLFALALCLPSPEQPRPAVRGPSTLTSRAGGPAAELRKPTDGPASPTLSAAGALFSDAWRPRHTTLRGAKLKPSRFGTLLAADAAAVRGQAPGRPAAPRPRAAAVPRPSLQALHCSWLL